MGRDLTAEDEVGTLYAADLDKQLNAQSFLLNFARLAESGTFRAQLMTHIALSTFREDMRSQGQLLLRLDEKVDLLLQQCGGRLPEKPASNFTPPQSVGTSQHSTAASSTSIQENFGMKGTAELVLCGKVDRVLNAIGDLEDQIDAKLTMTSQELRRVVNSLERTGSFERDLRGHAPDPRSHPENKMTSFGDQDASNPGAQWRPVPAPQPNDNSYQIRSRPGSTSTTHRSNDGMVGGVLDGYDRPSSRGSEGSGARAPSDRADIPLRPMTQYAPVSANPGSFFTTPRTNQARDMLRANSVLAHPEVARPARLEPCHETGDQYSIGPSSSSEHGSDMRRFPGAGYAPALPLGQGDRF